VGALARPDLQQITLAPRQYAGVEVPFLPLRGRWLRNAGFDIGRSVRVEVSEGRLTIERDD
jgi:hypothetical protein